MPNLEIELSGQNDTGQCDCCGRESRTVWGFIHDEERTRAAYFVQWTLGGVAAHGANFDFIVGSWGDETRAGDRVAVSLDFRQTGDGPAFMVIDAATRPVAASDLVRTALARDEVINSPIASEVFALADAVWLQDSRIGEITGG